MLSKVQSQNKIINNYTYTDNNPASGKNYYRVIEQDANGKSFSTLTKMLEINCLGNNVIKLYPNPANSAIFLRSTLGIKQIQIVNNTGQTIINKSNVQVANGLSKLDVKQLSGGIYICKVFLEDGTVQNIKFIKN
jgi:hypothetical protein